MDMNKMISKVGSAIVTVTVFIFAIFLQINYSMGSYFVCLILPIGFKLILQDTTELPNGKALIRLDYHKHS